MKYGSFCTGYGGLDLAVETYFEDAEMLWYSEVDKNCNKILEHRFPGVTNIGDLTQIENWNDIPKVDLICAGFPCQPYSTAGIDRKGDEDERAIFQYIADSLGVLGFPELFLENVSGILTLGGTSVIGSLAEIGYDCQWQIVRASDAGACHRRARWFCIASHSDSKRKRSGATRTIRGKGASEQQIDKIRPDGSDRLPENASINSSDAGGPGEIQGESGGKGLLQERGGGRNRDKVRPVGSSGVFGASTDSDSLGTERISGAMGGADSEGCTAEELNRSKDRDAVTDSGEIVADSSFERSQRHREHGLSETSGQEHSDWGGYGTAVRRWEEVTGRLAPPGLKDGKLSPVFVEWMMGLPLGYITDLGLSRVAELKALGNGVVWQQAYLALFLLNEQN
ncbi:MAG: DNA cytosine methyltransferase [Acidimicrobiales bacterium]|nr:DNA cytosine methyltransferase [Acidimicrobiales bacterium]